MATDDSTVLADKSKAIPPLHGGLQLSKITKKNDHVPYNMRCWKCCPSSSTHFWHLLQEMCIYTQNSISEIQSNSGLKLVSILLMCGFRCIHNIFLSISIDKNRRTPHIRIIKTSIRGEIDCISVFELMRVNAHFLKRSRNVWMKEDNISSISYYKVRGYFSL